MCFLKYQSLSGKQLVQNWIEIIQNKSKNTRISLGKFKLFLKKLVVGRIMSYDWSTIPKEKDNILVQNFVYKFTKQVEISGCIYHDPKTQKNYVNLVSLERTMIEGHVDV